MKKAYFQYYETFEIVIEKIKDIEEREWLRKVIIQYGLHGTAPESFNSEALEIAWTICKDLIDQQIHRREVNAANRAGKKAEPETNKENLAAEPQPEEKPAQEIQQEKAKRKNFVKPTVEEIAAFCKEKKININVKKFFLHYESNGWHVGKTPMKSWKAAVQKWAENNYDNNKAAGTIWANNSTDADTAGYEDLF